MRRQRRRRGPRPLPANRIYSRGRPNADTDCIEWPGARVNGYGVVSVRGRLEKVHRVSWALSRRRRLRRRQVIRHTCDNPACFSPAHLVGHGGQRANMADARERGRLAIGSRHGRAKLNEELVEDLRDAARAGWLPVSAAAIVFGVHPSTIRAAIAGRTWAHV